MSSTNDKPAASKPKRRRGPIKKLLLTFCTFLFVVIFIEGLFSTVHFVHTFISKSKSPVAEHSHTDYDADLGWAPIKGLKVEDGYGPGVPIHINDQGFRADKEYTPKPADGKVRVVAIGDSFTFGHDVANDHTWPAYVEKLDPRFEVINVGLGGYGVDQIYLRHERDAKSFDRDFLVFAFIMEDFGRAQHDSFNGYGKPTLALENGELVVRNQPVPRRGYIRAWLNQNGYLLRESRTVHVTSQIWNKLTSASDAQVATTSGNESFKAVLKKMWSDMDKAERARGSRLILAFIPAQRDYGPFEATDHWRAFVKETAAELDVPFFDMVEAFRAVPAGQVPSHFVDPVTGETIYHRGNKGNQWLAEQFLQRLAPMVEPAAGGNP